MKRSRLLLLIAGMAIAGFATLVGWNWHQRPLFTKEKWRIHKTGNDPYNRYPGREASVDDLIHHYHLKQRNYAEIIELLGKPNDLDYYPEKAESVLRYEIVVECLSDIDPNHFKYLLIVFESPDEKTDPHAPVKYWYIDEKLPYGR